MKAIAITSKGIEDVSALEVKGITGAKADIMDSCVMFEPKRFEDLCLLCYKAQSVDKVLFLMGYFKFNENNFFDDLKKSICSIDFSCWLDKGKCFMVSCRKSEGDVIGDITNDDVCSKAGEFIISKIKESNGYTQKVDLVNPDVIVLIFVNKNYCYIGIDFSGFDINKRGYRIFAHQSSLRGTLAYSLLRIAGFKEGDVLLDPFTGSGTIPIEAALYLSNMAINYYNKDKFSFLKFSQLGINFDSLFNKVDKGVKKPKSKIYGYDSVLGCISNSRKNAKIAGVNKHIDFARVDVEWLDTKFDKESVDAIITNPPHAANINKIQIEKVYNEFFYQAEFILKKDGRMALISKNSELLKKYAEKHKFKCKEERTVFSGKEPLIISVFEQKC